MILLLMYQQRLQRHFLLFNPGAVKQQDEVVGQVQADEEQERALEAEEVEGVEGVQDGKEEREREVQVQVQVGEEAEEQVLGEEAGVLVLVWQVHSRWTKRKVRMRSHVRNERSTRRKILNMA
jgi:hypothetical protein